MRDTQKESDTAEDRYRAAFALLEKAVRDGSGRDVTRPLWRAVDDALDAWNAERGLPTCQEIAPGAVTG